jgi:anti-sigma regulatory factor (Ser/Thr protein kinase)
VSAVRALVYEHVAVVHDGPGDLARQVAGRLRDGLAGGDRVLACLQDDAWAHLAAALGPLAGEVNVLPQGTRYATPGGAMATLHRFVDGALADGAPAAWSIGTLPVDGSDDDARWWRYEAAVDEVLSHRPVHAICTFDARTVPAACLDSARHAHGARPDDVVAARPRVPVPRGLPTVELTVDSIADARAEVAATCGRDLAPARVDELNLVVSELVTNAVRYGASPVVLRGWCLADQVVVEVSDAGPGIADPYPELRAPHGSAHGGFGLWLVGQLAHELSFGTDHGRTVVTASLRT